jgi:hypothetical protein
MFTEILCPACTRKLRLPDEVIGREVSCPSCGHAFVAVVAEPTPIATAPRSVPPAPSLEPHRPKLEDEPDEPRRRPIHRREFRRDFAPCPACDKSVRRGAVVCPHCGVDLEEQGDGRTRLPPMRRDAEPHRGGMIRLLGIGSLICAFVYLIPIGLGLGIAAWTMGRRDLKKMREGEMDRSGRSATHNGWVCGIAGTILNAIMSLGAALILTLIIHDASRVRTPPKPAFAPAAPVAPVQPWNDPHDFKVEFPPGDVSVTPGGEGTLKLRVIRGADFGNQVMRFRLKERPPRGLTVSLDPSSVEQWHNGDVTVTVKATKDTQPGHYRIQYDELVGRDEVGTVSILVTVKQP